MLFDDPLQYYLELKKRIPGIRARNALIMNSYHDLDESDDFWWVLTGEYALYASIIDDLRIDFPRIGVYSRLYKDELAIRKLSLIVKLIAGKDVINFGQVDLIENGTYDQLLVTEEVDNNFYLDKVIFENEEIKIPFESLCLSLEMITNLYHKTRRVLSKTKKNYRLLPESKNSIDSFQKTLIDMLPSNLLTQFPRWFVSVSSSKIFVEKSWVTFFGNELNIFQRLLLAKNFSTNGESNIKIIMHGGISGQLGMWYLFRLSLFPSTRLVFYSNSLKLKTSLNANPKYDILIAPFAFPWTGDFLSFPRLRNLMDVYSEMIDILSIAKEDGKIIRIKFKNPEYLRLYSGPLTDKELIFDTEFRDFEDCFQDYKHIICFPFGTIAAKCITNNISFSTIYYPCTPYSKKVSDYLRSIPGVFSDPADFLRNIEELIRG